MKPNDLSYLANRSGKPDTDPLFTFHYDDDGVEFGIGTMDEFEKFKAAGWIDPASHTRPVAM